MPHIFEFERRLPGWLRPTSRGAVCLFALGRGMAGKLYVAVLVVTLMLMVGPWNGVKLFLSLLALTAAAGAVGGTIHGLLGSLAEWGRSGVWLRWFLALLGTAATAVLLTPRGPFSLQDHFVMLVIASSCMVAAAGLTLLDDRRPGRLTPHQFRWLQHHDRRWTAARAIRAPARPRETEPDRGTGQRTDRAWAASDTAIDEDAARGLPLPRAG
jgi:hypothetical protein